MALASQILSFYIPNNHQQTSYILMKHILVDRLYKLETMEVPCGTPLIIFAGSDAIATTYNYYTLCAKCL